MSGARPPRIAQALLTRGLRGHDRDEILGDMAESHARRAQRGSRLSAHVWYWRQALTIPARLAWRSITTGVSAQELRHAGRNLLRSPAFTGVAVLSLAIGIGANAAIFSVIRSVLITPLPVEAPGELRLVYHERPRMRDVSNYGSSSDAHPVTGATIHSNYSYPIYRRLREVTGAPAEVLGFNFAREVSVRVGDRPAMSASGLMASGNFFAVLRPRVVMGRPFDDSDDRPDAPRVAVISHAFWQRAFGGDPGAVGSTAIINGTPFEIIGVTGPDFDGLSPGGFFPPTDVFAPFATQEVFAPRWTPAEGTMHASDHIYWVRVIARVSAAESAAPLEEAMTTVLRESLVETAVVDPEDADQARVHFIDGSRGLDSLRREIRRPLALLAGVVAAVLLIACVNLAGLMLARGTARRHELAVRRALGAGRLRLIRQLLLEALLLAGAGGVLGLLLAIWGGPAITAALTASFGRVAVHFRLDGKLLGVVAAASVVAAVLCGLLPALRLTRYRAYEELRTRTFGDSGGRLTLGRVLIAAQIAVSIPLIVGAGLFLRTLGNLGAVDLGFHARDLVIFRLDPTMVTGDRDRIQAIYRDVLRDVEDLSGVSGATLLENALLTGWISNTGVTIDGERASMYMNAVGPRYFDLMGIPLLAGRTFQSSDGADAPSVAIVNQTAADELFGGSALGRTFERGEETVQVVGVVADSKYDSLQGQTVPTFYDPYAQRRLNAAHVLVRTAIPPDRLEQSIQEIVARADPGLPITGLRSQAEQIETATSRERIFARLLSLFSGFALLVASIGLYGVTSFAVSRRRPEIGVRLALGARPAEILRLVLRSVMLVALVGLAIGLIAAWLTGPVVAAMLYGLEPTDLVTMAGAALVMLLVALAAGLIPARRAARTDALIVLSRD